METRGFRFANLIEPTGPITAADTGLILQQFCFKNFIYGFKITNKLSNKRGGPRRQSSSSGVLELISQTIVIHNIGSSSRSCPNSISLFILSWNLLQLMFKFYIVQQTALLLTF